MFSMSMLTVLNTFATCLISYKRQHMKRKKKPNTGTFCHFHARTHERTHARTHERARSLQVYCV